MTGPLEWEGEPSAAQFWRDFNAGKRPPPYTPRRFCAELHIAYGEWLHQLFGGQPKKPQRNNNVYGSDTAGASNHPEELAP